MLARVEITFRLNGRNVTAEVPIDCTLIDMLRHEFGLQSPRLGCGEGECGSCTVMIDTDARASYLTLAVDVMGREVLTSEGLAEAGGLAAAVPEELEAAGAVQCGYCMPGMAVAGAAFLLSHDGEASRSEIERALEGNLCRCTGYVKAVDAIAAASRREA